MENMINKDGEFNKRTFGSKGEMLALQYLRRLGYTDLKMNFRVGRMGEVDIIGRDAEYLCFIEVKTRRGLQYGRPSEAVTAKKQYYIRRLAALYIARNNLPEANVRFDVVEIIIDKNQPPDIHIIKNAF